MNAARLSRFYGMSIPDNVARAVRETLTDQTSDDLFVAHMAKNHGYFGAIDKTLSGFVLLDVVDDDAWLLDLRDSGAVWFQDHQSRELSLRFATLADYLTWRDSKQRELPPPPTHVKADRELATHELSRRLQWAVWLFSQPKAGAHGEHDDSDRLAIRHGIAWFHQEIGPDPDSAYREERDLLNDDPHLAISWLLVAAALADPKMHQDIVGASPKENPLFDAISNALMDLGVDGTLAILPSFNVRRARLLSHLALVTKNELAPPRLLAAARAAPDDQPLLKARLIFSQAKDMEHDDRGELLAEARGVSHELGAHALGRALTGFLDAHEGLNSDDIKDALRLALDEDAPLEERGFLLLTLGEAAYDNALRLDVARSILARDPFHFTALQHAAAAAKIAGDPSAQELEARVAALATIRPLYSACGRGLKADELARVLVRVHALPDDQRALFNERVLAAPDMFALAVIRDAMVASVKLRFAGRGDAWARGFAALTLGAEDVVHAMQREMTNPTDDVVADLKRALSAPQAIDAPPAVAKMAREQAVKAIEAWIHGPKGGPAKTAAPKKPPAAKAKSSTKKVAKVAKAKTTSPRPRVKRAKASVKRAKKKGRR